LNYNQAVDYILGVPKFTTKNDLSETVSLLRALGNPEKEFKVIHVAGTNGKGSVCFYLDTLLRVEGKTVGRFTSPHLERINERIVLNGQEITDDDFVESFCQVKKVVDKQELKGKPHPTFFELIFAISLLAFKKAKVEYVVLETGLGGRLDATNAVASPVATVITSIGYDHMKQLGNTLDKIASEKAGIIKKKVPLTYASTTKESDEVIETKARELGSSYTKVTDKDYEIIKIENNQIVFSINNSYYGKELWVLANPGIYQPLNALLALETLRKELLKGQSLSEVRAKAWHEVLARSIWQGRMEEVIEGVFIDGAHNLNAITGFTKSIIHEKASKTIVFGAVEDKDVCAMVKELTSGLEGENVEKYIITKVLDPKGLGVDVLANIFREHTDRPIVVIESPKEALDYALAHKGSGKIYFVGSLYLIGQVRRLLKC
jgi:dihydrofolate synthase/folylpolyglutamate synthase